MLPFIILRNSLALFPAGEPPINIDESHVNFQAVKEALMDRDFDLAVELATVAGFMDKVTGGLVEVSDSGVLYKGQPLSGYLANKLTDFFRESLPVEHYCLFLTNLMDNPSRTAVNELFLFLEAAQLPVTEDGCFLAYKAVRSDFKDKYSGKFDNSPGTSHSMPRNAVDDNRDRVCSRGFHAAAYEYARNFLSGGDDRLVAVKINPRDVVTVPSDYNHQKLRTCAYSVLFEIENRADIFKGKSYVPATDEGSYEYVYDEDFEDDSQD